MNRAVLPSARPVGSRPPNPFERAARTEKRVLLVAFIDAYAVSKGVDPLGEPERVLDALGKMNAAGWAKTADKAHVNPPSEQTIAEVRKVYEQRRDDAERRAS
jgi:hypothetical protein